MCVCVCAMFACLRKTIVPHEAQSTQHNTLPFSFPEITVRQRTTADAVPRTSTAPPHAAGRCGPLWTGDGGGGGGGVTMTADAY